MPKNTVYQLHGYKITESHDDIIQWEKYADFGVQQSGRCFVVGRVLVIGNPSQEKIGCLIGEYHDQLKGLPHWSRTAYYCREDLIICRAGGAPVPKDLLSRGGDRYSRGAGPAESPNINISGCFRLGEYLIEVKPGLSITWSTCLASGRLVGGVGEIAGHILFLLDKTFEGVQNRKQFQANLKSLPAWSLTEAYIPFGAAVSCAQSSQQGFSGRPVSPAKIWRPVVLPKRKIALKTRTGRLASPKELKVGFVSDEAQNVDKKGLGDRLDLAWRLVSSWLHTVAAGISNKFSGPARPANENNQKSRPGSRPAWKSGLAGFLVLALAVMAFVAIFFHHEFEGLAQVIHPEGHGRSHHHQHHSDH